MVETILLFIILTICTSALITKGKERTYLLLLVTTAWIIGLPLLFAINEWLPFTGGDDLSYYRLADTPIRSWKDVFDFGRFRASMAQPGYPWFLSLINYLTGHNLFAYKTSNLLFLILLSLVWYKLGELLVGKIYARKVALVILCCTPLWYYVLFLLKDLTITFFQSLFLLGLVENHLKKSIRSWLIIIGATFAIIFLRTPLAMLNVVLVAVKYILPLTVRKKSTSSMVHLILMLSFVAFIVYFLSNPHNMNKLGIYSESRMLGVEGGMVEMAEGMYENTTMNRSLFPALYIFGEISGLNPNTWTKIDAFAIRGLTYLPWVFFGAPMFAIGMLLLLFHGRTLTTALTSGETSYKKILLSKWLAENPWPLLLIFSFCYFLISWQVGDTTRWRLPDIPVVSAIALYGWCFTAKRLKYSALVFWLCIIGILFPFFYLVR